MNVASVQKHFRDLAEFITLATSGAKAASDLTAVAAALDPFRAQSLSHFADFLRRADDYHRTGKLTQPPATPKRQSAKPAAAKADPQEAIRRVVALYQRILDPQLTVDAIEAELALLDKLKKDDLLTLAQELGNHGQVKGLKTNPEKLAAIKKYIRDRRGMSKRPDY